MDLRNLLGDELLKFCLSDYEEDALDDNMDVAANQEVESTTGLAQSCALDSTSSTTRASPTHVPACKWTPWIQYIYKHCSELFIASNKSHSNSITLINISTL